MAIIKPPGDGGKLEGRLDDAERLFDASVEALRELRDRVKAGDIPKVSDVAGVAQLLTKSSLALQTARTQLDEQRRKDAGIARDYAIDFSQARDQVRILLDRLRDAKGSGELS
jgi:hypothetical protein